MKIQGKLLYVIIPLLLCLLFLFIGNIYHNLLVPKNRFGACGSFPAGTIINTKDGMMPIEKISTGTYVNAYNIVTGKWSYTQVTDITAHEFNGDLVTIKTGDNKIQATGNHPFRVIKGLNLEERPDITNIPENEKGLADKGKWVEARNLRQGDILFAGGDTEQIIENIEMKRNTAMVYDLKVDEFHTYTVGLNGILVSDTERGNRVKDDIVDDSSRGGCFPAGTEVKTKKGFKNIEEIKKGTLVYSFNINNREWSYKPVLKSMVHNYSGDIITILAKKTKIEATGNHPFRVRERNQPLRWTAGYDISPNEQKFYSDERWALARNLQPGDILLLPNNNELIIEDIYIHDDQMLVYNLKVADNNTYTIHKKGILVHNKGEMERASAEEDTPEYMDSSKDEDSSSPEYKDLDSSKDEGGKKTVSSGLRAGYADDNKQYNYFLHFLEEYKNSVDHIKINVEERIIIKITDKNNKPLPNAEILIKNNNEVLCRGTTYSDGSFYFFPSEYNKIKDFNILISYNQVSKNLTIDRYSNRSIPVTLDIDRPLFQSVPADILFMLDTTGSMGEEIKRLKNTIEIIYLNLSSLSTKPDLRFGMVLYKDKRDEYTVKTAALTKDLNKFQKSLDEVDASGGGDLPEDLQSALQAGMNQINWNKNGIRLIFVITDAPPHLDYGQEYTYYTASKDASEKGIKIYTVGTGGLNIMGEYILRQISQYTGARYIFLTYGETGESEGGKTGSVSHHTGFNYETDKLESIIIKFAKEELQYLTEQPIEEIDEYFQATKIKNEDKEESLDTLFTMAVNQLIDYSSIIIKEKTPLIILPVNTSHKELPAHCEFFTEHIMLSVKKDDNLKKTFNLIDRENMQKILSELEFQLSDMADEKTASEVGKLIGAELIITGTLYQSQDDFQLFLKLIRVETAEILSVTKAVIDKDLGL